MKIPNLDEVVIDTLNLFSKKKLPKIKTGFRNPLVVGSGNAAVTGQIIFEDKNAVFADESDYKRKLKKTKVDGAILISASGGKHAPIIAKDLKRRKIKTILITNNENAPAKSFASKTYIFPKNVEPYTYNTSTYMGMILGKSRENPKLILKQIKKMKVPSLKKYDAYYFMIPERLELIKEMFLTKFDELFGSKITARVFTEAQTKHAKTVVPSEKELFIGLGYKDKLFGKHRLNIPLSKKAGYAEIMAVGYYFIGKIQRVNPPYFKKNIEKYTKEASKIFGHKIEPIVK